MNRLRPIASLFFAAVLVLTSGAMAVARGQAAPVGAVELCAGQGVVTVAVDAQGRPTGPVHLCPDCALSLFAAPVPPQAQAARRVAVTVARWVRAPAAIPAGRAPAPYDARGPPPVV